MDDTKIASKVVDGEGRVYGFGLFSLSLAANTANVAWFHKIYAPGDLVENEAPANKLPAGACISEKGNYVDLTWNTYGAGRAVRLRGAVRNGNTVTVTGNSNWPSGITVGSTINLDGVTTDPSFNGKFVVTNIPSANMLAYAQTGASRSISAETDPNAEIDYAYYGEQAFSANNGAFLAQISRAESHNDEMLLADGSEALGGGYFDLTSADYRRWEAYQDSTGKFFDANAPYSYFGPQWHFSGRAIEMPGWALISTYAEANSVDCTPQSVMCAEIMAVKMDGSNTFYRIGHSQSVQCPADRNKDYCEYFDEPHATPDRNLTKVLFGSDWRTFSHRMDVYLIELEDLGNSQKSASKDREGRSTPR